MAVAAGDGARRGLRDGATFFGGPSVSPGLRVYIISLIGSSAQALLSLAALAPGLSEAELRVCLHLASIQDPENHTARASSRQIAAATRVARANVQRALDSLTRRHLIATRQGGGSKSSAYRLNFTDSVFLPGLTARPPAQTTLDFQAPQWPHSEATSPATNALDIDKNLDSILDRVLKARPQHFQESQLREVRGFAYKWLTMQRGQANAPAPDRTVCARLITAAGGTGIACDWIRQHLEDRQADTAEYLVTWMLQRIHGIAPLSVKARRAELRAIAGGRRQQCPAPPIAEQPTPDAQADPQFAADLVGEAVRKAKAL